MPSFVVLLDQPELLFLWLDKHEDGAISLRLLRLVSSKVDSDCYAHG